MSPLASVGCVFEIKTYYFSITINMRMIAFVE